MNQHSSGKIPVNLILSNLAEDAEKARTRVEKAPDVLLDKLDTQIAATPYEVVHQLDRMKLKHLLLIILKNTMALSRILKQSGLSHVPEAMSQTPVFRFIRLKSAPFECGT